MVEKFECICRYCGNIFYKSQASIDKGNNKYCSQECYGLSKRTLVRKTGSCKHCGKEIIIKSNHNRIYCSKKCQSDGRTGKSTCLNCNKEIVYRKSRARSYSVKYCSRKCQNLYHRNNPNNQKICKYCGKSFFVKTSAIKRGGGIFCTHKCYVLHAQTKIKTCLNCGKEFNVIKSYLNINRGLYCSIPCYRTHQKLNNYVTTNCKFCNKEIRARKKSVEMGGGVFCSRQCTGNYNKRKITIHCRVCRKAFEVIPAKAKTSKYCSLECTYIGRSRLFLNRKKSKLYYGPNWKKQRLLAYERDKGECQACHRQKLPFERGFDVHHISKRSLFNEDYISANRLDNLITLCKSCHRKVETGKIICPLPT